jgi:precorrin-6B methylase 2
MFPLRMGSPGAFATVREFLKSAGYTEEFIKSHFNVPAIEPLLMPQGLLFEHFEKGYQGEGTPLFLTRLFLGGYAAPRQQFHQHFPREVMDAFLELGLLQDVKGTYHDLRAPVLLYPAYGLYITSDAGPRMEGVTGYSGQDFVMSGTEDICRDFIDGFSKSPCDRFLDMGTGSGLAAILGAGFASHVWAVDITERATRFTNFNRMLNGVENLTVLRGDLYEPVKDLQFDRIVSNPPFEPPLKSHMIYSEGGSDGEQILARLITEAPERLVPGGRLYANVCGTDRNGETFDERVLRWLGIYKDEFDVGLFVRVEMKPELYSIHQILGDNLDGWRLHEFNAFYGRLLAYQVVMGMLVIQRRASDRPVFRVRRKFGPHSGSDQIEWLMDFETRASSPSFAASLLSSTPVATSRWELVAKHAYRDGRLTPVSYMFQTKYPFDAELSVAPWIAMVVADCNGKNTLASLYESAHKKAGVSHDHFIDAMHALLSCDIVRLPDEKVPAPSETPARQYFLQ